MCDASWFIGAGVGVLVVAGWIWFRAYRAGRRIDALIEKAKWQIDVWEAWTDGRDGRPTPRVLSRGTVEGAK